MNIHPNITVSPGHRLIIPYEKCGISVNYVKFLRRKFYGHAPFKAVKNTSCYITTLFIHYLHINDAGKVQRLSFQFPSLVPFL